MSVILLGIGGDRTHEFLFEVTQWWQRSDIMPQSKCRLTN